MGRAVRVLAIREAIKAVKKRMQAQGLKVQHKVIVAAADDYLASHRAELVAEATKIVERWHTEGAFGPRGGFRSRS
jgi:muramoyltetrapeptide carboxypeptidase LdcA involved in peptidoglycan recycling